MPVDATGGGSSTELDRISISNVKKKGHLYAHAIMAWVFMGFVMFTIARERLWLIGLRQAWALSTPNSKRLSSRTVLFLSAPKDALDPSNMHRFFGEGAVRIWPVTETETLQTLVTERNSLVEKLEVAEASLIRKANSRRARKVLESNNLGEAGYSELPESFKKAIRPRSWSATALFVRKEDKIKSLREQIKEKEELLDEMRKTHGIGEPRGAAAVFVEFKTQAEAQRAYQQVSSSNILALTPRYAGVKPDEIIWNNLTIPPASRISQDGIALAIVSLTTLFWSIPSGFIGLISNISYLAENFEWLSFLKNLPDPVIGLVSGLLPPLLTSLLTKYVATIFRSKQCCLIIK